jgi:hypothetical protein
MEDNKSPDHINTGDIELEIRNQNKTNKGENNHFYEHVENLGNNEVQGKSENNNNLNINNNQEEDDNDLRVVQREKFKIPHNLKKTFLITMMLFIIGSVLIGTAFIEDIREGAFGVSISMWTLGSIVMIPGGYYAYQFYLACKASGEDRDDILAQIPEM